MDGVTVILSSGVVMRFPITGLSSVSLAALALAGASPAFAQTEDQQVQAQSQGQAHPAASLPKGGAPAGQEIIVTGSRIKRPNFETIEPAVVIDSKQIESRGFETLGQAINEQPSFGVPGSSP